MWIMSSSRGSKVCVCETLHVNKLLGLSQKCRQVLEKKTEKLQKCSVIIAF